MCASKSNRKKPAFSSLVIVVVIDRERTTASVAMEVPDEGDYDYEYEKRKSRVGRLQVVAHRHRVRHEHVGPLQHDPLEGQHEREADRDDSNLPGWERYVDVSSRYL